MGKSFHYFLLYFPNLITFQLTFLVHILSLFDLLFCHIKSENIGKIWKKIVKWFGKYGRKISWIVKWYGKYGRKVSHYSNYFCSIFSISFHYFLQSFPYLFNIFFCISKSFHYFLLYFPNLITFQLKLSKDMENMEVR
jgi:hypothetical protein